ncbi:hypothetical protein EJD97_000098 [Solanum chilense]|uniref:Tf2-1-like SH3-like domain-containing protein n=1 Tax=Solanum chilense TaxID=4083 RepID=A0A6N2CDN4_SOLCI|nr:hypothetical protein EJD97_000098 [Solanum chilense]
MKGVMRSSKKVKLSPRYMGPYHVVKRIGSVAYQLKLPIELALVHPVLIEILDRQVKKLRNKEVASIKVLWKNRLMENSTWEAEVDMMSRYPYIFPPLLVKVERME